MSIHKPDQKMHMQFYSWIYTKFHSSGSSCGWNFGHINKWWKFCVQSSISFFYRFTVQHISHSLGLLTSSYINWIAYLIVSFRNHAACEISQIYYIQK